MRSEQIPRNHTGRNWLILWVSISLLAVLLATALLFLLVINKFTVEVTLRGRPEITMEYGEDYDEQGAAAVLRGSMALKEGVELDVWVQGSVPSFQLGEFPVTYTASFGPWSGSASRVVTVVDTEAPVITLFSHGKLTQPGQSYREEGYIAVDNYDGDITDQVQVFDGPGVKIYTVTDSSGNMAMITRSIRYAETE